MLGMAKSGIAYNFSWPNMNHCLPLNAYNPSRKMFEMPLKWQWWEQGRQGISQLCA
jgi:hypothetical protein